MTRRTIRTKFRVDPVIVLLLVVLGVSVLGTDPAEARRRLVSGRIYEDILGDGSVAGDLNASGVRVRLYADTNDNGQIDNADLFLEEITTNNSGRFSFKVQTNATGEHYLVAVESRGVSPSAGFNGGFGPVQVWAEQTYGDDPSTRPLDTGPRFGGLIGGSSDNFNAGNTNPANNNYQHVGRADVSTAHAMKVDFGFSFNVVTNTDGANSTRVQGSLRQFVDHANAIVGDNLMRFVPAVATNASGGGGQWWKVGLTRVLPSLTDPGTTVDGTAYDRNDGARVLDPNPGSIGSGGTVGGRGLPLVAPSRPELEITGTNGTRYGLRIEADRTTVRGLSVNRFSSFGWSATMGAVLVQSGTGTVIEANVLGSGPGALNDPGAWRSVPPVVLAGAPNGFLRGNVLAFSNRHGVEMRRGSDGWLIEGNEIFSNAMIDGQQNGLSLEGSRNTTIAGNLIHRNGGAGVDVFGGAGVVTILDNTIRDNGTQTSGNGESSGIRLDGGTSLVQGNVIRGNRGSGVLVTAAATGHVLSMNRIHRNGGIGIDLLSSADNNRSGTAPYVTLNDAGDGDSGGNGLLNFPVLESALNVGGTLTLTGWGSPGSLIEVFIAAVDPSGFGEGESFVVALQEGSAADLDGLTGSYGPQSLNGTPLGQDTTNRFQFVIPLPAGVVTGSTLTATGTLGGSTSEFGGTTTVTALLPNILVSKTVVTESDPVNLSANPKAIPGAVVLNMITATNTGPGGTAANALWLTDPIPVETAVFVGDMGGGTGPLLFVDGAVPGGLTLTFGGLNSLVDDIEFSRDGGGTWDYVPVPDGQGFDPLVTHLRLVPKGAFAPSDGVNHPSFTVSFRTRVR